MKKPPKPRPPRASSALPPAEEGAASERSLSIGKRILAVLGAAATVLSLGAAVMHYWPQLTVEPTAEADVSNPLSGYFKITNAQGYPLTKLKKAEACEQEQLAEFRIWLLCVKNET